MKKYLSKMQRAGLFYEQQQREQEMLQLQEAIKKLQQPTRLTEDQVIQGENAPYTPTTAPRPRNIPQPSPANEIPARELQGLNERMQQRIEDGSQFKAPEAATDIRQKLFKAGLGVKAAATAASYISGIVARNRDNQYDYKNLTGLGMQNPMPADDFQPGNDYNPYAKYGGNPFSNYAKYGGNLKTIMKDFKKFSNDIAYEFGDGGSDSNEDGMMKKGGYEIDRMLVVRKIIPELLQFGRLGPRNRFPRRQQGGTVENPLGNEESLVPSGPRRRHKPLEIFPESVNIDINGNIVGTPQQRERAVLEAQRIGHKLGLMDPSNMQIGQYLPQYVDPSGRPYTGPAEKALPAFIPPDVSLENIYSEQGMNWYIDKDGNAIDFNPVALNAPRFKRSSKDVVMDQLKRPATPSMASLQMGGMAKYGGGLRKWAKHGGNASMLPYHNMSQEEYNMMLQHMKEMPKGFHMMPDGTMMPDDEMYKKGGIYIKPQNRGKFTDYCGGKVTEECIAKGKNSPSAKIRKRATFAQNARKWNHGEGGEVKKGGLTPNKAREILHDGTAQGHPLTDRQRRFFGAMSKGHTNYRK